MLPKPELSAESMPQEDKTFSLRDLARSCLHEGAWLRTSRRSGLYITNDTSAEQKLEETGFSCTITGSMLCIGISTKLLPLLLEKAPAPQDPFFAGQLRRLMQRTAEAEAEDLLLLEDALRQSEPGNIVRTDLDKRLRNRAAVCLRTGTGGATLYLVYCYSAIRRYSL